MKLTIKHYYSFGKRAENVGKNLLTDKSWDAIRIDDDNENTPFSIPKNREDWVKKCIANKDMADRAKAIGKFSKEKGFKKIISFGVGACFMEYNLKNQYPDIILECSDFSPNSVERLKGIFTEADKIYVFDMLKDDFENEEGVLYLFHRLDTDFSNSQWKDIFERASRMGINNILFVPGAIDTLKSLTKMILGKWYQIIFKRSKLSFAGYLRNKSALKNIFNNYYRLSEEFKIGDLTGFYLNIK
ncbi:MAG: hypothetical protein HY219_02955 [Candidatus Staskawiczbacteria bacterium]|nr:hypothetical protein [Candidatus Staskawiczbacteria bacterium]